MSAYTGNVLHVSNSDLLGGAARSAYKIHGGVRQLGMGSRMLVKTMIGNDPDVALLNRGKRSYRLLDALGRRVVDRAGLQYFFYPSSRALPSHPWFQQAQVVQLHSLHGGFFSFRAIAPISNLRPVVWRLSDMWPFTGHCTYSHDCDRWASGCGRCPLPEEYPALNRDTTALLWKAKKRTYDRSRLVLVATNSWMEGLLTRSPLLSRFPRVRIPNGVDVKIFRPVDKTAAREVLGIAPHAPVVLFLAHVARPGTRKGGQFVGQVMAEVVSRGIGDAVLLVVGEGAASWPEGRGHETLRVEFSHSDHFLAAVYSAADVILHPALVENFPNTILESMACGTPAVAFQVGGVPDLVRQGETGFLASLGEAGEMASAVCAVLRDKQLRAGLSARCRRVVQEGYTVRHQAEGFARLYARLVSGEAPKANAAN